MKPCFLRPRFGTVRAARHENAGTMKTKTIFTRFHFAICGIRATLASEWAFRTELLCFVAVLFVLVLTRPDPIWWALVFLTSGALLAVELVNTAVEKLADHLHPKIHPALKIVKDTLAGAVLMMATAAVLVFLAFLWMLMTPLLK